MRRGQKRGVLSTVCLSARRSQVSTFLIVALVLTLVVAVTFFAINLQFSGQDKANQAVVSDLALFPPEQFVAHCVQQETVDAAKLVFAQGGVADIASVLSSSALSQSPGAAINNASSNAITASRDFSATTFRAQPYLFWTRSSVSNDVSGTGGSNSASGSDGAGDSSNMFMTNDFISGQLNSQLPDLVTDCLNLSLYAAQGYTVKAGTLRTNTSINPNTIHVLVYFPLTLTKGSTTIDRTTFAVDVDLPLGRMLDDAREITNSHLRAESGTGDLPIDTQALMQQTANVWQGNPLITINKMTVYPQTLYSLVLNYKGITIPLQFAIEGTDAFSTNAAAQTAGDSAGNSFAAASSCISSDGACYVGVSYDLCTVGGGAYQFGKSCPSNYDIGPPDSSSATTTTAGNANAAAKAAADLIPTIDAFSSCSLSNGTTMASGSSWCATSADGSALIGVGSRDSRLLCVDGKILQEPCQDYRTEICAQQRVDSRSSASSTANSATASGAQFFVAQCRPNTALSCSACTDSSCCDAADCTFKPIGGSATAGICEPKIPQGIPFWQPDVSASVCQAQYAQYASQISQLSQTYGASATSSFSTPQAQAQLCAASADCGATVSVVGEPSQTSQDDSYYSQLISFWESQSPRFLLQTPTIASGNGNNVNDANGATAASASSATSLSTILGDRLADLEPLAAYSEADYLNPNITIVSTGNAGDLSAGVCSSFTPSGAAGSASCGYCAAFGRACSEYVCRSLGATCRALQNVSSDSGVTCVDSSLSANSNASMSTPLLITSVTDAAGNALQPMTLVGKADDSSSGGGVGGTTSNSAQIVLHGYVYSSSLSALQLLTINLTTNRPALCKPTYLPFLSFSDVSSLDLSQGTYTATHQLRLRFVNDLPVFDNILSSFAVPNYEDLVSALATFKLRLDQLRLKYGFIQKYNPTFYPYLDAVVSQYLSDKTRPILLALLDGVAQKKFSIFFVCQDEFGAQLATNQSTFVQIQLQPSCQPIAPQVLHIVPDAAPYVQRSVAFFLDKAGSCKYDTQSVPYDSMRYNMTCASSEYDISSAYDGSYECDASMTVAGLGSGSSGSGSSGSLPSKIYYSCADTLSNELYPVNVTLAFSTAQQGLNNLTAVNATLSSAATVVNISNASVSGAATAIEVGRSAILSGVNGYRCAIENNSANTALAFACTANSCTAQLIGNQTAQTTQAIISCSPRVPTQSCQYPDVHVSDPAAFSLSQLPSFTYDSVGVVNDTFVVTAKSRGGDITCLLTDENGATFVLTKKDNTTFTMPSSLLTDNSLVKITCTDAFGTGPQYVSLVEKRKN